MWKEYSKETEKAIQEFWKKNKILEKSRKKNFKGKPFYLMDGPPFPTGSIHLGTALNKSLKDTVMRSKRMQGFNVFDKAGWDCHGLPTELKVEKKLGLQSKEEIESKVGVEKFIKECTAFSTEFIGKMSLEFENLGVWMDFENSFKTLDNEYIESVWWSFKKAADKGLLFKGIYPIQVCPSCETSLSFNEIEHEKLTDKAIFIKFKVKGKDNEFLIIWTTTPWTLPGNSGIMAHPELDYAKARLSNGEVWIVAKQLLQELMRVIEAGFTIEQKFKGKELEGLKYENPLEKHLQIDWSKVENAENKYKVVLSSRYVSLEHGTGLVHCASGHGREDFDVGKKAKLPLLSPVSINGLLTEEAGKYAGKKARIVDNEIIEDLKEANALVFQHDYAHEYPVCWRCSTPLLMISLPQWFFKTESLKKKAKELNEKVYWIPEWAGERFKNWIEEGVSDWPVTRNRYWGTPAPVWECKKCNSITVVGSLKELKEKSIEKIEIASLHKPWIDEVKLKCGKCKGVMQRVPEILDGWFDAGVSSWAALNYPKEKKLFEKNWPSDLNIEGRDQIRGWWNSQLMCSMMAFEKAPFKAVGMHGFAMDLEKKKMSKSKGNIVTPSEIIEKQGRDAMRYYFTQLMHGEDFGFDWNAFKEINKVFATLQNSFNYLQTYLKPKIVEKISASGLKELEAEDKWLISKANSLENKLLEYYDSFKLEKITQEVNEFVSEELSKTYIKLVRERIRGKDGRKVEKALNYAFTALLKVIAPIMPHLAEFYYQKMKGKKDKESVHLLELKGKKKVNERLEKEMGKVREIATAFLALREEKKLKLRWQLNSAIVQTKSGKELKQLKKALARMINVKKLVEVKGKTKIIKGEFAGKELQGIMLWLNVEADGKLMEEWELAELLRRIQDARKQAGLNPKQKVEIIIECSDARFLRKFKKIIEKETGTKLNAGKVGVEKVKLVDRDFGIELKK